MTSQREEERAAGAPRHFDCIYLSTKQLAARWGMSPGTLNNQRWQGTGIPFVKIGHLVKYRLADVEAYERASTRSSTTEP